MKSLFTGIDSASHTVVSSAQVIYSFMSLFHVFVCLLSLLIYLFQIDRLEPSLTDSVFRFRIPCFCAREVFFLKTEQKSSAFIRVDVA